MLHGEVHGALEALVARVHDLPRQPIQRLLHVQIVVRVVQIVVSQPWFSESKKGQSFVGRLGLGFWEEKRRTVSAEAIGEGFHVLSGEPVLLGID